MDYSCTNFEEICRILTPGFTLVIIFFALLASLAVLIIKAVVSCKIFSKAGYHWALGLLMLVPIACIIMPFVLAFGRWPTLAELDRLRRQQNKSSA